MCVDWKKEFSSSSSSSSVARRRTDCTRNKSFQWKKNKIKVCQVFWDEEKRKNFFFLAVISDVGVVVNEQVIVGWLVGWLVVSQSFSQSVTQILSPSSSSSVCVDNNNSKEKKS